MVSKELDRLRKAILIELSEPTEIIKNNTKDVYVPPATDSQLKQYVENYISEGKQEEEEYDDATKEAQGEDNEDEDMITPPVVKRPKMIVEVSEKVTLHDPKGKTFQKVKIPKTTITIPEDEDKMVVDQPKKTTLDEDVAKLYKSPNIYGIFSKYFQCKAVEVISPSIHKFLSENRDVRCRVKYVEELRFKFIEYLGRYLDNKTKSVLAHENAFEYMKRTVNCWGMTKSKLPPPMVCMITQTKMRKGQCQLVKFTIKNENGLKEVRAVMSNEWVTFFEHWINMARLPEALQKLVTETLQKEDPEGKKNAKERISYIMEHDGGRIVKDHLALHIECYKFFYNYLPDQYKTELLETYDIAWFAS